MPTDRYTKTVLTVIAASLVVLIVQNAVVNAIAQQPRLACPASNPCYVSNTGLTPLNVTTAHVPMRSSDHLRGIPEKSGQIK